MLYRFISVISMLVFLGCRVAPDCAVGQKAAADGSCSATSSPAALSSGTTTAAARSGGYLMGYLVSAFNVRVNGVSYTNSEDFYTQELTALKAQVASAGYGGYTMTFNAQIGLNDLTVGMDVYVEAEGGSGYAGNTTTDNSGRFMLAIPSRNADETFQVLTNKRVSVYLTSPDKSDKIAYCYNFSSIPTSASLDNMAHISDYKTTLTAYKCSSNGNNGMEIPAVATPAAPVTPAAPTPMPAPAPAPTTTNASGTTANASGTITLNGTTLNASGTAVSK